MCLVLTSALNDAYYGFCASVFALDFDPICPALFIITPRSTVSRGFLDVFLAAREFTVSSRLDVFLFMCYTFMCGRYWSNPSLIVEPFALVMGLVSRVEPAGCEIVEAVDSLRSSLDNVGWLGFLEKFHGQTSYSPRNSPGTSMVIAPRLVACSL